MQRVFKFQGRAKEDGKLVYGDLVHEFFETIIQHVENGERIKVAVIPESVGQFTGFFDKKRTKEYPNGQEIYEGGLVAADAVEGTIHGIVRFGTYEIIHNGFYIDWKDASHGTRQDIWFWVPRLTVVEEDASNDV